MKTFTFVTNDITVKNNRGLKGRNQFAVEMEIERTLFADVIGIEAFPTETHFKVTVEPIGESQDEDSEEAQVGENLVANNKGEIVKKEETIYQKFKRICIEYSGESYYQRVKKHLGVEHLREIGEKHKMSESMVEDVFRLQMNFIDNCMQKKSVIDISSLTHKDNAVLKWKQLFEIFNLYNKNEKEV